MTWRSDETHAFVACDFDGCEAATGHHPYRADDDTDRVSAMTYAADAALRAGWEVPAHKGEGHDRCPAHLTGETRLDYPRPDVVAHCPVSR